MNKIVLIGPESTGKSTLCKQLAERFCYEWEPEYAREYVERLKGKYTYEDVEAIALHQKEQFQGCDANTFFDTDLIITKVWFDVVYKHTPEWIKEAIEKEGVTLYLLCKPDIPWVEDPTRENGDCREQLYRQYKQEIEATGVPYEEIGGIDDERKENAIKAIQKHIK